MTEAFVDMVVEPQGIEALLPGIQEEFASLKTSDDRLRAEQNVADYIKLALFASEIGIPFCIENNHYYRSPHAVLHEMGHFAVKPDSYIKVYRALSSRDFQIVSGDIIVSDEFGEAQTLRNVPRYVGDNDRMPDWDLPDGMDPTPNEKCVRAWSRWAIQNLGIQDPLSATRTSAYETASIGDTTVAKGSSFRTWAKSSVNSPIALKEFAAFGFDPENRLYRPDASSLILPHESPKTFDELEKNVEAMAEQYPTRVYRYKGQVEEWRKQVRWKYDNILA